MRLFTGRITAGANGAYLVTSVYNNAIPDTDTAKMCIVMHSPLWSQNNHNVSAQFNLATIDDKARRSREDFRAAFLEYVDALVHTRISPRFEPEGIFMPIVEIGAGNRVNQALRYEETETDDERRDPENEKKRD